MKINSVDVKEMLKKGGTALGELLRDVIDGQISQECENVFERTIELGIENTIRALLEAKVDDDGTVSALREVWGLSRKDAAERVAFMKRTIATERLDEFLLLNGMRQEEAVVFRREYDVFVRLRNEELLSLWDKPEQLRLKLVEMGKDPRPAARLGRSR